MHQLVSTGLCCAPPTCVVQKGGLYVPEKLGSPLTFFMFDNKLANQGSQCSSVLTHTLVVHNIDLYRLGGTQDGFACSLSNFFMMYNAVLSVSVSVRTGQ